MQDSPQSPTASAPLREGSQYHSHHSATAALKSSAEFTLDALLDDGENLLASSVHRHTVELAAVAEAEADRVVVHVFLTDDEDERHLDIIFYSQVSKKR